MVENNNDNPAGKRPHPAPTIDLSAKDVTASEAGQTETGEKTDRQKMDRQEAAQDRPAATGPNAYALVAAFLGGLVVAGLAAAGLWFAGVLKDGAPADSVSASRLERVEAQLRDLAARPNAADPKPLADLTARVARIESMPADTAQKTADDIAALRGRVDEIAAGMRVAQSRADEAARAATAAQETARANAAEISRPDFEALQKKIADLESVLKANQADLAKRVQGGADDRAVRLAVVTDALTRAVEGGKPYATELAALKALSPQDTRQDTRIAALEPFAEKGIASDQDLARALQPLLPSLAALQPETPPAGILQTLRAHAEKLIRIRPAGEPAGDDIANVVARIESKAAQTNVAGVMGELQKLPQPLRAPLAAWMRTVDARQAAIAASRDIARSALSALGKSAS